MAKHKKTVYTARWRIRKKSKKSVPSTHCVSGSGGRIGKTCEHYCAIEIPVISEYSATGLSDRRQLSSSFSFSINFFSTSLPHICDATFGDAPFGDAPFGDVIVLFCFFSLHIRCVHSTLLPCAAVSCVSALYTLPRMGGWMDGWMANAWQWLV